MTLVYNLFSKNTFLEIITWISWTTIEYKKKLKYEISIKIRAANL
jgi:hypothetical protein